MIFAGIKLTIVSDLFTEKQLRHGEDNACYVPTLVFELKEKFGSKF